MASHRSSRRRGDDREDRGRRRRYTKEKNYTGAIVFFVVFGILAVVSIVLFNRVEEKDARGSGSGGPGVQAPTPSESEKPEREIEVSPDRPAPEVKGRVIQDADALFQKAKILFARAEIAEEEGRTEEHSELLADCRKSFAQLHDYLKIYTTWHADAKREGWPVPRTYRTLEKRVARYGKLEARLPPK